MAEYKNMDKTTWKPLPFLGVDTHGGPQVWTMDGDHWQEGTPAPEEVHTQLLKRFDTVNPDQFKRSASLRAGRKPAEGEDPTAGGENEAERKRTMDTLTSSQGEIVEADGTLKEGINAPVANQSVAEGSGGNLTATPGEISTGSLPNQDDEEEEEPNSPITRKRRANT